jgi:DNA-directed RNA polymerase subunit L
MMLTYDLFHSDKLAVSIQHSPDTFTFTVETTGSLDAKDVVKDALKILMDKITRFQKALASKIYQNEF